MRSFRHSSEQILLPIILLVGISIWAQGQALQSAAKPAGTGSIAGQVLVEGKPAPNATVVLLPGRRGQSESLTPVMKATSDKEGKFKFEIVPAGDYRLNAVVPGFINPDQADQSFTEQGKLLAVDEGEAVTGIEISLKRGSVITGRVTDASDQPLIEAYVRLWRLDKQGNDAVFPVYISILHSTNDQGVYRFYGLPEGRYKISVGQNEKWAFINGQGSDVYIETFHPAETDQMKATIIELSAGEEATNIDIKLSRQLKAYTARGRLVEAQTGRPVTGKSIMVALVNERGEYQGIKPYPNLFSTETGEFRIEGLTSGRYMAYCQDSSDTYSEPVAFEINDADVAGLELKIRPAASLSGRVVIEGVSDPQILALAQAVQVMVNVEPYFYSYWQPPGIAPDGSFKINGLPPGKAHLGVGDLKAKGLAVLRIERGGEAVHELNLKEGEELKGVRVVMAYGLGSIRGTLRTATGKPPADVRLTVQAYRLGIERTYISSIEVDGLGRFVFQGLLSGDYELLFYSSRSGVSLPLKKVSVNNGAETPVDVVVDLTVKDKDDKEK